MSEGVTFDLAIVQLAAKHNYHIIRSLTRLLINEVHGITSNDKAKGNTCANLGYTNKISYSRWHKWSTEAGGLAVNCLYFWHRFHKGGTIFLAVWERGTHFIGYIKDQTPFYLFTLCKTQLAVGWSFISWSMLNLEGWSSTCVSIYFIGVDLYN